MKAIVNDNTEDKTITIQWDYVFKRLPNGVLVPGKQEYHNVMIPKVKYIEIFFRVGNHYQKLRLMEKDIVNIMDSIAYINRLPEQEEIYEP